MAEALVVSGPTVCRQSANQSEAHLSGGEGLQEEGGANQRSAYCKEQLTRGGEELSFEELRAERYQQRKQREMEEKLRSLAEVKQQLSLELEEKKRLLLMRRSQRPQITSLAPPPASFNVCQASAAARPAGVRPDQSPDHRAESLKSPPVTWTDHLDPTKGDLQTRPDSQRPVSTTSETHRPNPNSSVETRSLLAGGRSPLEEDQDQEETDQGQDQNQDQNQATSAPVDPCDPDVRRRLLEVCDVTSSPGCQSELRPLPAVEENTCVHLGGAVYHIYSRVMDGDTFSVFKGATENDYVLLKVDRSSVLWDFHQFHRLRMNSSSSSSSSSSSAECLPLISCFQFVDGCVTIYTTPPGHMFTELEDSVSSESVGCKAVSLLRLLSELDCCRLVHGALQPRLLTCCHRGFHLSDWVLPVDWSSSVDLDLQPDVTSVQQLPSAQPYISLGLLEPTAPPQLVDLVGVAETVHVLLTNSRMVPIKDASGWTAELFSGDEPCDMYTRMWRRFFRSLLNPGGRSSRSVLSELKDQLTSLYQ